MKTMLKKMGAIVTFCIMAMVMMACGSSTKQETITEETEKSEANKIVRLGCVGTSNSINDAGGIAQHLGYLEEELEKEGYDLEVIGFAQAGPAINEAFSAGEIDMAIYGDMPATICKASGIDTTIFATVNSEMQMGVLVREGSQIQSLNELKGKKVIVAKGTIYHQYFKNLIADAGIAEEEIEQINTFTDATSVISSGNADVLISSTSTLYYLEEQGIGTVIETTQEKPEWTAQFMAVGATSYLEENREAAIAVIRALDKAQKYSQENPQQVYEILAEMIETYTPEIYKKVYSYDEAFEYYSPEITEESMEKLKAMEQFLEEENLTSSSVDMDTFVDTSYYEEAMK